MSLASAWLASVAGKLQDLPVHSRHWHADHKAFLQRHYGDPVPMHAHWRAHILEMLRMHGTWEVGRPWQFSIATRNTKRLIKGDVALTLGSNGFGRQPIWCSSSKGARIVGCYESCDLYSTIGTMHWLGRPDELVGKSPADPAVADYVLGLRAGRAAAR